MEMKQRLCRSSGVTEQVLGLDLVEWQLRRRRRGRFAFEQERIVARGPRDRGANLARDPADGSRPRAGRLAHLRWRDADPGVRVDAASRREMRSRAYDSARQVIGAGPDRAAA